jgi:hypothetical protein
MRIQAINQFIHNLQVKELKGWTKVIEKSVLTSKNINNPNNSTVMKKRLKEEIYKSKKLTKYIEEANPSRKLLRGTLVCMGNEKKVIDKMDDRDEMLKMMLTQLDLHALQYILEDVSVKTLQMMVAESQLSIKSSSKPLIVRHLVEMKDYVPPVKKAPRTRDLLLLPNPLKRLPVKRMQPPVRENPSLMILS